MILPVINETLPATGAGFAAISLPSNTLCRDFTVQVRGSVDAKISQSSTGTPYFTLKSGAVLSLSQATAAGDTLFYVESGSTADTIEIIITR